MRVNEIFYSLQGEGFHTGTPAVFVRLCGCNLKCDFCDTDFSQGEEMSDDEVLREVLRFPARFVVLTGGEPALQLKGNIVKLLKQNGFYVTMETNGTIPLPQDVLDNIDWITCSPKSKEVKIQRIDELKIVYEGQDLDLYSQINARQYSIQPCDRKDEAQNKRNLQSCIDYVLSHPHFRISLQTHKFLGIR